MLLAAWLHTLSPFVLRISDTFGVRWYGLAYLAGFLAAYLCLRAMARRGLALIPEERLPDAMMWLIGGALVGGRLGYVLVYDRSQMTTFTGSFPFWGVLAIHHGGMASHGGMVGVIVAAWRISRGWKTEMGTVVGRCPVPHVMDLAALVCPFGLFFGRIANFVNGELLGRIVTPPGVEGPWWTVQFPQELTSGHAPALNPAQHAELMSLASQYMQPGTAPSKNYLLEQVIEHASANAAMLKPLLSSREPSQLLQAAAEGVVVGAVV